MKKSLFVLSAISLVLMSSCKKSSEDIIHEKINSLSEMAELGTVEYTIKKIIKVDDAVWYKYGDRKILFSCTAYLKAGIDMKNFSPDMVKYNSDQKSVEITLPKPVLLSYDVPAEKIKQEYSNVSGFRLDFTPEEKLNLKQQGEASIVSEVSGYGILEEAEKNATDFFVALLQHAGIENVNVSFK